MFPAVNRWMRTPLAPVGLAALAGVRVRRVRGRTASRRAAGPAPRPARHRPDSPGRMAPGRSRRRRRLRRLPRRNRGGTGGAPDGADRRGAGRRQRGPLVRPERLEAAVAWRSPGTPERDRTHYQRVDGGVALRGPDGDAPVAAVFGSGLRGSTPVSFPGGGRMRELRVSWSRGLGSWIETPGSEGDADPLGEVDPPEETAACLRCHATAVRWVDGTPALRGLRVGGPLRTLSRPGGGARCRSGDRDLPAPSSIPVGSTPPRKSVSARSATATRPISHRSRCCGGTGPSPGTPARA